MAEKTKKKLSNLPKDMLKNGGPGRPKGSRNKFSKFRDALLENFEKRANSGELDDMRLDKVSEILARISPKEQKIEMDAPIVIRWENAGDSESTSE